MTIQLYNHVLLTNNVASANSSHVTFAHIFYSKDYTLFSSIKNSWIGPSAVVSMGDPSVKKMPLARKQFSASRLPSIHEACSQPSGRGKDFLKQDTGRGVTS